MTPFQIISITAFTLIMALIGGRLYWLARPKLTPATTVLFTSLVFFGLFCYFGVLTNYAEPGRYTPAQARLEEITYHGMLFSLGLSAIAGTLALGLWILEQVTKKRTP